MPTQHILICDDQQLIHETLGVYLKSEGYTFSSALNGGEAITIYRETKPDLIILDLMMPVKSGIEVCREIRDESRVPIIMLTAKGEEIDRVLGLELGADDYIVKPFSAREVVARIKAILRRYGMPKQEAGGPLRFGELEIDMDNYDVRYAGDHMLLSPKEVEILYLLASHVGRVYTREQMLSQVWGYDYYGDTRAVDTQIKRIRQKLPDNTAWGIKTVYGVGYKFEADNR